MKVLAGLLDRTEGSLTASGRDVRDWDKSSYRSRIGVVMQDDHLFVGTIEDKELLDPAKAYAMGRFNVLNATMELDLAVAKLARATGWDAIAPDGLGEP